MKHQTSNSRLLCQQAIISRKEKPKQIPPIKEKTKEQKKGVWGHGGIV
jgi:hypothetical protein